MSKCLPHGARKLRVMINPYDIDASMTLRQLREVRGSLSQALELDELIQVPIQSDRFAVKYYIPFSVVKNINVGFRPQDAYQVEWLKEMFVNRFGKFISDNSKIPMDALLERTSLYGSSVSNVPCMVFAVTFNYQGAYGLNARNTAFVLQDLFNALEKMLSSGTQEDLFVFPFEVQRKQDALGAWFCGEYAGANGEISDS